MFNKVLRWFAFLIAGIIIFLLLITIVGSIYQWRASIHDRQEYPPGQFVDLGDHQIHLYCTGSGSPTVILESGSINTYLTWTKVQPKVAEFTRVCSYDRAGLGWSSPIDEPQRSSDIAKRLYQLLNKAEIKPPYVLAGHSRGGLHVRTFNSAFPETVLGLILIDSAHEQQYKRYPKAYHQALDKQGDIFKIAQWLAPIGIVRLLGLTEQQVHELPLPPKDKETLSAIWNQSHVWETVVMQREVWIKDENQSNPPDSLGNLPLVVIRRGQTRNDIPGLSDEVSKEVEQTQKNLQKELSLLSTNSEYWVAKNSGHAIPWEQPHIVNRAIRYVWKEAND